MRHFLTSLLAAHWAVVFGLLAAACVVGGANGASLAFNLLGVDTAGMFYVTGASASGALSLAFALVAVLFAWALVHALFAQSDAEGEQVTRMAFGGAACALSLVLVVGALSGSHGVLPSIAITLAALLASYLAAAAEYRAAPAVADKVDDARSAARLLAAEAAHNSMLTRLTGRADLNPDGR